MTAFSASFTSVGFDRHHHVVNADRDAGAGGVEEAERLDVVEHRHRGLETEAQIAVLHQLREALLLEQAVDERHVVRQHVVQNDAADRRVHVLLVVLNRLGVHDVLLVEGVLQVDHAAGVAQLDGGQRFHFAHLERDQHVGHRGELRPSPLVPGRFLVR
jgi:hypothetical protein